MWVEGTIGVESVIQDSSIGTLIRLPAAFPQLNVKLAMSFNLTVEDSYAEILRSQFLNHSI